MKINYTEPVAILEGRRAVYIYEIGKDVIATTLLTAGFDEHWDVEVCRDNGWDEFTLVASFYNREAFSNFIQSYGKN